MFKLAHFVGVSRPGHELPEGVANDNVMSLLEVPALAISSTDVRQRASKGSPIWYLVPDGVVRYVDKYDLYQDL